MEPWDELEPWQKQGYVEEKILNNVPVPSPSALAYAAEQERKQRIENRFKRSLADMVVELKRAEASQPRIFTDQQLEMTRIAFYQWEVDAVKSEEPGNSGRWRVVVRRPKPVELD